MNRFKFRVWNEACNEMITDTTPISMGINILMNGIVDIYNCWHHDVALMQFTGLKDSNGVEVFEGDILEIEKNCLIADGTHMKAVEYFKDQFCVNGCSVHQAIYAFNAVVVGNIYQNLELLVKTEDIGL